MDGRLTVRHNRRTKYFGRSTDARKALIRGLVQSLVEHGRIKTTVAKAKEARRHAEKAVTIGREGTLHARRILLSRYPHKPTVDTLLGDLAQRFKKVAGGYTRIIKIGPRPGDGAEMAFLEFTDYALPELGTSKKKSAGASTAEAQPAKAATVKKRAVKRKAQSTARKKSRA